VADRHPSQGVQEFRTPASFKCLGVQVPSMTELRTYKTGLRAPCTLVEDVAALSRERQVLCYLETHHANGTFDGFLKHVSGLSHAPTSIKAKYRPIFNKYKAMDADGLSRALDANKTGLRGSCQQDPRFQGATFRSADIGAVSGTATPDPSLISLHDYSFLGAESLKMACATVDAIAREVVVQVPADVDDVVAAALQNAIAKGNAISEASLRRFPEKAIAHLLGRHGNVELTAFEQVAAMMEVYRDTCGKVDLARDVLFPPVGEEAIDVHDAGNVMTVMYSIPVKLVNHLARKWYVEPRWVRNTLVGWRRKIDPLLPVPFQVEPLTGLCSSLAAIAMESATGEDEMKVIGILQRKQVLHLLPVADLSQLLPADLQDVCRALQSHVGPWPDRAREDIESRATSFTVDELCAAGNGLKASVEAKLPALPPGSNVVKNTTWYIANIDAILAGLQELEPAIFEHYMPGARFTGAVTRLLALTGAVENSGRTKLFTALRGIVALAFATRYPGATATLERALVPEHCVTLPYMSRNRKKHHLPLNLMFNKYVVERKAHPSDGNWLNNDDATTILARGDPIWLGIPIYSPDQLDPATRKLSGNRKGVFWFQLVPTKAIVHRLGKGALVETIRLNVPSGADRKIVADVILSADDHGSFTRRSAFIKDMDVVHGKKSFPGDDYIGMDLNTLGKHTIAVGTCSSRISLFEDGDVMAPITKAAERIVTLTREIALLQAALASPVDDAAKRGRMEGQLSLLFQRRARIRDDAERRVLMVYLYCLHRTGAVHAGWDAVAVDTRGKRGTLATAITYMPKRADLMVEFASWAADLQSTGLLPRFDGVTAVSPYTGQACDECFAATGKQARSRKKGTPYHTFECTSCGTTGNRHEVSARVSALVLREMKGRSLAAPT